MFRLALAANTNWAYASCVVVPKCAAVCTDRYSTVPVSETVGVSERVMMVAAGTAPAELDENVVSDGAVGLAVCGAPVQGAGEVTVHPNDTMYCALAPRPVPLRVTGEPMFATLGAAARMPVPEE